MQTAEHDGVGEQRQLLLALGQPPGDHLDRGTLKNPAGPGAYEKTRNQSILSPLYRATPYTQPLPERSGSADTFHRTLQSNVPPDR